jgi:hypothetical protein
MMRFARTLFDLLVHWRRRRQRQAEWQTWPTMHFDPNARARMCAVIDQHETKFMALKDAIAEERRIEQ